MLRPILVTATMIFASQAASGQSLIDPGFETSDLPGTGPGSFGVWGLDVGERVGPTTGIAPLEGSFMARFVLTTAVCATEPFGTAGDFVQLVDLSGAAALVASGNARVRMSAAFNRVAGDTSTDTRFSVNAAAYDGTPDEFISVCSGANPNWLAASSSDLQTDGDPTTWERIDTELVVPIGATYVAIWVRAIENVEDDPSGSEFDGHFVDDVTFEVVDASATTCLADFDGDGVLTIFDFLAFQSAFLIGCP